MSLFVYKRNRADISFNNTLNFNTFLLKSQNEHAKLGYCDIIFYKFRFMWLI